MDESGEKMATQVLDELLKLRTFLEVKFDRVEGHLDRLETRLERVETRLTSVDGRVAGLEHEFADFRARRRRKQ
jgi:predicted  nucleic acid-binding Zn-ribbon protein